MKPPFRAVGMAEEDSGRAVGRKKICTGIHKKRGNRLSFVPSFVGGAWRIRTAVDGFADR